MIHHSYMDLNRMVINLIGNSNQANNVRADLPGASVVVVVITPVDVKHCGPVQDGKHVHTKEFPLGKQVPPFIHGLGLHGVPGMAVVVVVIGPI